MALLDSEVARIRYELGFATLTVNAEPFIGFVSLFSAIIQQYVQAGASTTCATAVTAAASATPKILTLASATGFNVGDQVFVDVDDLQEQATVRSLSGSTIGVLLRLGHTGTYPVGVDGGEAIVRGILRNIRAVKLKLAATFGEGALRKVDEIEFWGTKSSTTFGNLSGELMAWRAELSQVLSNGQQLNMWRQSSAGAARVAVY